MIDFDKYKHRLELDGTDIRDKKINSSIQFVNNAFADNPSFRVVQCQSIDEDNNETYVDTDAIVNKDKKSSHKKNILFRPGFFIYAGKLLRINDTYFLVMDFQDNPVYPQAKAELCNNTLRLSRPPKREYDGTVDEWGNPNYVEVPQSDLVIPCIVSTMNANVSNTNPSLLTSGTIQVTIGYSSDPNITYDKEFYMVGHKYKIHELNYTDMVNDNTGILHIEATKVPNDQDGDAT